MASQLHMRVPVRVCTKEEEEGNDVDSRVRRPLCRNPKVSLLANLLALLKHARV